MASLLGISLRHLYDILRGRRPLTYRRLRVLANRAEIQRDALAIARKAHHQQIDRTYDDALARLAEAKILLKNLLARPK